MLSVIIGTCIFECDIFIGSRYTDCIDSDSRERVGLPVMLSQRIGVIHLPPIFVKFSVTRRGGDVDVDALHLVGEFDWNSAILDDI